MYGAKLPSDADPITAVFNVDPEIGQPADWQLAAFGIEDWNDYHPSSWWSVVIEDITAYWAEFHTGPATNAEEVLAAKFTEPDGFTVYEFDVPPTSKEITGFSSVIDADGAYLLIKPWYEGGTRFKILIYDIARDTSKICDTSFDITDVQVMFIEG